MVQANNETETTRRDAADVICDQLTERLQNGETYEDIMNISGEYVAYVEHEAFKLYQYGRLDKAKVLGKGLVTLNPNRPFGLMLLGDIALREQDFVVALEMFGAAVVADEQNAEPRVKLAETLLRLGDRAKALEAIESLDELEVDAADPLMQRAQLLARVASRS